jgi:hypothetical protein
VAALNQRLEIVLKAMQERSAVINHRHRLTGDAVIYIIEEVIAVKGKIKWRPVPTEQLDKNTLKSRLLNKIQDNLEKYRESI